MHSRTAIEISKLIDNLQAMASCTQTPNAYTVNSNANIVHIEQKNNKTDQWPLANNILHTDLVYRSVNWNASPNAILALDSRETIAQIINCKLNPTHKRQTPPSNCVQPPNRCKVRTCALASRYGVQSIIHHRPKSLTSKFLNNSRHLKRRNT